MSLARNDSAIGTESFDGTQIRTKIVLKLLDGEIKRLHAADKRDGWTPWALKGALATVVWLLLIEFEHSAYSLPIDSALFLISLLLLFGAKCLQPLLYPPRSRARSGFRLYLSNNAQFGRPRGLLVILLAFTMAYPAKFNFALIAWPLALLIVLTFSIFGLLVMGSFICTYYPLPILAQPGPRFQFSDGYLAVVCFIGAAAYITAVLNLIIGPQVCDLRIAGLLASIVYLLWSLGGVQGATPLLHSLEMTRRDLLLDRISLEAAIKQIDIALDGLQVSDYLQSDVEQFLASLNQLDGEVQAALKKMQLINSTLKTSPDDETEGHGEGTIILLCKNRSVCIWTRRPSSLIR